MYEVHARKKDDLLIKSLRYPKYKTKRFKIYIIVTILFVSPLKEKKNRCQSIISFIFLRKLIISRLCCHLLSRSPCTVAKLWQ